MEKKNNVRKIIQAAALILFLAVLPFLSLQYLRKGYFERKNALDQLRDYGQLPAFQLQTQEGESLSSKELRGGYVVMSQLPSFDRNHPVVEQATKLFEEFGNSKEIALCTYVKDFDADAITAFMEDITVDTLSRWYFLEGDPAVTNIFDGKSANMLALIDTALVVRNYYSADNDAEIGEMAKHIAMFVSPLKRRAEIEFERKREK